MLKGLGDLLLAGRAPPLGKTPPGKEGRGLSAGEQSGQDPACLADLASLGSVSSSVTWGSQGPLLDGRQGRECGKASVRWPEQRAPQSCCRGPSCGCWWQPEAMGGQGLSRKQAGSGLAAPTYNAAGIFGSRARSSFRGLRVRPSHPRCVPSWGPGSPTKCFYVARTQHS